MNVILICLDYKDRHRMKRCPFLCFVGLYLHWLCFSFDQVQQCVRVMLNQVITRDLAHSLLTHLQLWINSTTKILYTLYWNLILHYKCEWLYYFSKVSFQFLGYNFFFKSFTKLFFSVFPLIIQYIISVECLFCGSGVFS